MNYKSIFYKITIGLFFISGTIVSAQNQIDSINIGVTDIDQIQPVFEDNLDSTLNLWYAQHPSKRERNARRTRFDTEAMVIVYIPDTIYAARLAKLPFSFKMTYNSNCTQVHRNVHFRKNAIKFRLCLAWPIITFLSSTTYSTITKFRTK